MSDIEYNKQTMMVPDREHNKQTMMVSDIEQNKQTMMVPDIERTQITDNSDGTELDRLSTNRFKQYSITK